VNFQTEVADVMAMVVVVDPDGYLLRFYTYLGKRAVKE
jgi:hypothetical protein